MKFADDKIRMHFVIGPESVASMIDTRDTDAVSEFTTTTIKFKRSSNFLQGV